MGVTLAQIRRNGNNTPALRLIYTTIIISKAQKTKAMKKVVIRYVKGEWQIATVFAGLYNVLVSCGTFAAATRYASENGMKWSLYSTN